MSSLSYGVKFHTVFDIHLICLNYVSLGGDYSLIHVKVWSVLFGRNIKLGFASLLKNINSINNGGNISICDSLLFLLYLFCLFQANTLSVVIIYCSSHYIGKIFISTLPSIYLQLLVTLYFFNNFQAGWY